MTEQDILSAILTDIKNPLRVDLLRQIQNDKGDYYITGRAFGSPKLTGDGIKNLLFPISHPSVRENEWVVKATHYVDLPTNVGKLYRQVAMEQMAKDAPTLSPLDFCIMPKFVKITPQGLGLTIIDGAYSDVTVRPNWQINEAMQQPVIRVAGKSYGTLQTDTKSFRVYGANCPNPLFVAEVDYDKCVLSRSKPDTKQALADALESIGTDKKITKVYRGIPEEIVKARLSTLWDFFSGKFGGDTYFADKNIRSHYIADCMEQLLQKHDVEVTVELLVSAPEIEF